ncbi:hypothetical protein ACGF07_25725 [Kitasatospora sp. NPDC048194]|uniref:hypothetical protein n=1 Tax=Kitasatospora sp. NPDC048194 TaxID=3364045 RepID=UPI0037207AB7
MMAQLSTAQQEALQRIAAHAKELPVRQPDPRENAELQHYMDDHGDPTEWTPAMAAECAQKLANLGGAK